MRPNDIQRLRARLEKVYDAPTAAALASDLAAKVEAFRARNSPRPVRALDERDALLISYADSILDGGRPPLAVLADFLERRGRNFTHLHLLPFYPYTSDDGFAVTDYRAVRPDLGGWDDLARLSGSFRLCYDGVINHASSQCVYMKGYLAGDPAYADFFIDLPPETDTSKVLRTRSLPLFHDYPAADGTIRHLWTTFGPDQVDFNFRNPVVTAEIIDVLLFYVERGARMIRLDAIPYMWKELGTSCAHLPETHELIKLIRDVLDLAAPDVTLLTETNVPHRENVVYFGDRGDEAQVIYNFTLAPLLVWSILKGDATVLSEWAAQVGYVSDRATYLNITATHDGIGVRPTEGILSGDDRRELVDMAIARGGNWTGKTNSDGSIAPYEINLNYFDAVNDPRVNDPMPVQIRRFLLTQAVTVAFIGIPGIYIHSLAGSRNDYEGVARTGRARSINRAQLDLGGLEVELSDPESLRRRVFDGIGELLAFRATRPELSPAAAQRVLSLDPRLLALERTSPDGRILYALFNFSGLELSVRLPDGSLRDAQDGGKVDARDVRVAPFEYRFLSLNG